MSNKLLITPLFLNNYQITTLINLFRFVPRLSDPCSAPALRFLGRTREFELCIRSSTRSGRRPDNKTIGMRVIYSEGEEAAASSASMLGTPMRQRKSYIIYFSRGRVLDLRFATITRAADVCLLQKASTVWHVSFAL